MPSDATNAGSEEIISFRGVNIVTPSQKLLASQLSCDVSQGKSLLVTGNIMLQRLSGLNLPAPCWHGFSNLCYGFCSLKVQMVAERVPSLGCFEACGPLLLVVLASHLKEFLMFLNVHILVLEPWGIRSYTLSLTRRQSWRCSQAKQVGAPPTFLSCSYFELGI